MGDQWIGSSGHWCSKSLRDQLAGLQDFALGRGRPNDFQKTQFKWGIGIQVGGSYRDLIQEYTGLVLGNLSEGPLYFWQ